MQVVVKQAYKEQNKHTLYCIVLNLRHAPLRLRRHAVERQVHPALTCATMRTVTENWWCVLCCITFYPLPTITQLKWYFGESACILYAYIAAVHL